MLELSWRHGQMGPSWVTRQLHTHTFGRCSLYDWVPDRWYSPDLCGTVSPHMTHVSVVLLQRSFLLAPSLSWSTDCWEHQGIAEHFVAAHEPSIAGTNAHYSNCRFAGMPRLFPPATVPSSAKQWHVQPCSGLAASWRMGGVFPGWGLCLFGWHGERDVCVVFPCSMYPPEDKCKNLLWIIHQV